MTTYYVFKPGFEITAEVQASNTKHARTAFLDYLSRNNLVNWNERQGLRASLKAVRMDPSEYQTSVQLEYGLEEPPSRELPTPGVFEEEREEFANSYPESEEPEKPADFSVIGGSQIEKLSRETMGHPRRPSRMGE